MLTGPNVILTLKIAVALVSVVLAFAVFAITTGRKRLHD